MIALSDAEQIQLCQLALGVAPDGIAGKKTQDAWDKLTRPPPPTDKDKHDVIASSFADPADVEAFKRCKAQGHSDTHCFGLGDNGIGCWGDSTVEGSGPSCALPPEVMKVIWGSKANAKHQKVAVQRKANQQQVVCVVKDQMPSIANLANEAMIDLNPDACYALGLKPPIMEPVTCWFPT